MAEIHVQKTGEDDRGYEFDVRVDEGGKATNHRVTLSRTDHERLGRGVDSPEALIEDCFRFLLEREPKESILGRFDVSVIGRYFPDFEGSISKRDQR